MVNTSKYPSNPQETPQSGHPGVTFRAILLGIILIPAEQLFHYGKPSALLEYAADNDVADLQRSGNADGADVSQFLAEAAVCLVSRSVKASCSLSMSSFQFPRQLRDMT